MKLSFLLNSYKKLNKKVSLKILRSLLTVIEIKGIIAVRPKTSNNEFITLKN